MRLYLAGNFPQLKDPALEQASYERVARLNTPYERLNSFYYHPDIETVMDLKLRFGDKVRVFLDSGAPTLYNLYSRKKQKKTTRMGSSLEMRMFDDFSFLEDQVYLDHKANYIQYIKDNEPILEHYANLDIINNPKHTWKNQIELERHGLTPIPVWHFADPKIKPGNEEWLKGILARGHEYIAIGGLVPNPPGVLIPALDLVWKKYLLDSKGMPTVKVHGFAVTSPRVMNRYPWYSVDSTSWVKYGKFGIICVPKREGGKYVYGPKRTWHIFVSTRSPKLDDITAKHIDHFEPQQRGYFKEYFEEYGFELGESEFKTVEKGYKLKAGEAWTSKDKTRVEVVVKKGLCNDYTVRDAINLLYYVNLRNSRPEWPWPFIDHSPKHLLPMEVF